MPLSREPRSTFRVVDDRIIPRFLVYNFITRHATLRMPPALEAGVADLVVGVSPRTSAQPHAGRPPRIPVGRSCTTHDSSDTRPGGEVSDDDGTVGGRTMVGVARRTVHPAARATGDDKRRPGRRLREGVGRSGQPPHPRGIANEAEAERLARGCSGVAVPRGAVKAVAA